MKKFAPRLLAALALLVPFVALAKAPELVAVKVFPADVNLSSKIDYQAVVVQAVYSDSTTRDVTAQTTMVLGDPKLAKLDKATVYPLADGKTELQLKFEGRTLTVPVVVEKSSFTPPISFQLDVMPVFGKGGCNTGSCHGSARGKDGFRLSVFGFDPDGDYHRITREQPGRRINLALPDDSLLLDKATGRVQHTGGKCIEPDGDLYQTVIQWLKAGAPKDAGDVASVVDVQIYPTQAVLEGAGASQQFTVRARYTDGTDRDITRLCTFITNNEGAAKVTKSGLVTADKRGEAFIMARFDAYTVGSQVLSIPKDPTYEFPAVAENNYIDTLVHAKLKKIRIKPSEVCDDGTFLRRVSLDIAGALPTPDETRAFLASTDPKKRDKKIDELLERPEFTKIWVMKWAELLQIRTDNNTFQYKSALQYYSWLEDQFAQNVPIDRLVQDLLTATGGTFANPAANFYKVETDMLKMTENVAQVFMGMRIQCAQCHNHPFDRWTMNDYYSFAAFFAQIGRKTGEDQRETVVFNRASGGVSHPVGNRDMPPKYLGGAKPSLESGMDRRESLAKWLASPENPFFARNLANIVWAHFFGMGIVDEVDDVRISNPPSNPELIEELGRRFTDSKYNFKKLVRDICTSRTYQLSSKTNPTNAEDTRNFAHAGIRRLRAEVLLDAINQVTSTKDKFRGLPLGARAVEIVDGRTTTYFLSTFGRASRDTVCSCEVKMEPNLSQALHLLNGETVNSKITSGGLTKALLKEGKTPAQIIDDFYWRCFSRGPTKSEQEKLVAFATAATDKETVLNDLFWAVLNSKEFIFNH
ncbi:surface protein [Verrucomicrobiota bacterium]|nr:surface protein [Verrucomicrobiota bacterium]